MTVAIPDMQQSAPVPSLQAELAFPQLEGSTFPECATPLETTYLPFIGEPPPPYPGN